MLKHYLYRMDHNTGFAPRLIEDFCIFCGCMKRNVGQGRGTGSSVSVERDPGNQTLQSMQCRWTNRTEETQNELSEEIHRYSGNCYSDTTHRGLYH